MPEDANDGQTEDAIDTPGDTSADAAPADDKTTDAADAAASAVPVTQAAAKTHQAPGSQPSASEGVQSSSTAPTAPSASPQPSNLAELSAQFREAAAEIAEIAAQAGRLGIAIDAAKALREGTTPEALRKLVLQRAADASDARDVVAAAPSPLLPKASESPIVAAAKRAAASPRG